LVHNIVLKALAGLPSSVLVLLSDQGAELPETFLKARDYQVMSSELGYFTTTCTDLILVTWLILLFGIMFQCYLINRKWTLDTGRENIFSVSIKLCSGPCSTKASDINCWLAIFSEPIFLIMVIPVLNTSNTLMSSVNHPAMIRLKRSNTIAVISLPISMVLKLQMPIKQKFGVSGMFTLGFSS